MSGIEQLEAEGEVPGDLLGIKAVEKRMHVHDLHATILHLMGIDHERLTYRYSGRDFRLTDVHGKVARETLAQRLCRVIVTRSVSEVEPITRPIPRSRVGLRFQLAIFMQHRLGHDIAQVLSLSPPSAGTVLSHRASRWIAVGFL